jgi:hypothetical protein
MRTVTPAQDICYLPEIEDGTMHDVFRDAVEKAKKSGVWEQLTPLQQVELVGSLLRNHFDMSRMPVFYREQKKPTADKRTRN